MSKLRLFTRLLPIFLFLPSALAYAELSLNGVSQHSELGTELFIAGLYTTTPSTNRNALLVAQEEKQIQVRVTADKLSSRRFKRMWIEGMAVNASSQELQDQATNMAAFNNMLKVRLIKGDIFTLHRYIDDSGTGVKVIVNGVQLGEITDTQFFDLLLRTWLGPVPLSSEFRNGLVKAGDVDAALLERFLSTVPSDERIADVESAIRGAREPQVAAVATEASRPRNQDIDVPEISAPAPSRPNINVPKPPSDNTVVASDQVTIARPVITAPTTGTQQPAAPKTTQNTAKPKAQPKLAAVQPTKSVLEDEEDDFDLSAEGILKQQNYVKILKSHSNKFLKYPRVALDRGWEGSVRLSIVVNRDGSIVSSDVLEEADKKSFTKAALRAVEKADPFPPVPKEVKGDTFTFTLPILFILAKE